MHASTCDIGSGVIRTVGLSRSLLVALLLGVSCGESSAPPLDAAASVVAVEEASDSLGFDVDRHGWGFGNYAASGSGRFSVADAVTPLPHIHLLIIGEGSCLVHLLLASPECNLIAAELRFFRTFV